MLSRHPVILSTALNTSDSVIALLCHPCFPECYELTRCPSRHASMRCTQVAHVGRGLGTYCAPALKKPAVSWEQETQTQRRLLVNALRDVRRGERGASGRCEQNWALRNDEQARKENSREWEQQEETVRM